VGSLVIVVRHPGLQRCGPDGRGPEDEAVRPAPLHGLDEALRLAVGLRGIGLREALLQSLAAAQRRERVRDVAPGVVAQDPLAPDAEALEPSQRPSQELRGAPGVLGRMDLRVGQARVVVDAHEGHLVASATTSPAPIAVDAMSHAVDASQLLRIDVEQVARRSVLVALRRILLFVEPPDAAYALGLQVSRHGRDRNLELAGDLPARLPATTQLHHAAHQPPGRTAWQALRSAAAVLEALLAAFLEAVQPLVGRLAAHACGASRLGHRPVFLHDSTNEQKTGLRGQLRVRMELHLRSPFDGSGWSATPFPPKESQVSISSLGPRPSGGSAGDR